MERVTKITKADMADVALGGAFLGTGGGGDPYIGRLMAEQAIAANGDVSVLDVDTLSHRGLALARSCVGPQSGCDFLYRSGGIELHHPHRRCCNGGPAYCGWRRDGARVS